MLPLLIDSYLLEAKPDKATLVKKLLVEPDPPAAARPFLEGVRLLGARTPDLALIGLRLALVGMLSDDESVTRFRDLVERARRGGADGEAAKAEYRNAFA